MTARHVERESEIGWVCRDCGEYCTPDEMTCPTCADVARWIAERRAPESPTITGADGRTPR